MDTYIIHNEARSDRSGYVEEARRLLPGLIVYPAIIAPDGLSGCTRSHQSIILRAKKRGDTCVGILEDDVLFSPKFSASAWKDMEQALLNGPFSILAGGVSGHTDATLFGDGLVEVRYFSGTQMVIIRQDVYDGVLASATSQHIDGIYSTQKCRKAVTVPFMSMQHSGDSNIRNKFVDDTQTFMHHERIMKEAIRG